MDDSAPAQVIHEIEALSDLRIEDLLRRMGELNASDLYLIHGRPPEYRVAGRLVHPEDFCLTGTAIGQLADGMMAERHQQEFKDHQRADIAYAVADLGRFRVNIYSQRGSPAIVIRRVNTEVPSFEELGLPPIVADLALAPRGLVLVTGQTGSGKSTTLAAMIRYRSQKRSGHIVTIEDPIEFVHPHAESIISQREVGMDTNSFHLALRDALRQAPDVILIGEIRDEETATAAVHFAETGHLVLSTLHSTNASQTLERLLHFFPAERHEATAMQLSLNLNAIISQRLIRKTDGQGRVPAIEVMVATPRVRELLRKNDLTGIRSVMQTPSAIQDGMQTFDYALHSLIKAGSIDVDTAMAAADSPSDLRMRIRGLT